MKITKVDYTSPSMNDVEYADVFVYEGSKRIMRIRVNKDGSTNKEYFINDYQGSPVVVVAEDESIKYQNYQDPWGNMEMSIGVPTSNPEFTYTDKELDEDSGLYYFQARYYDPIAGRFMGRDNVSLEDCLQDPRSYFQLSAYQFCGNNPLRNIDHDGRKIVWGDNVLQNPKVKAEMEKLNQAIVDSGVKDDSFTLIITGGDRYTDFFGNIRSRTNGKIVEDSKIKTAHNEEEGAIGVDFVAEGVSKKTVVNIMREKTAFGEKGAYIKPDYEDDPHIHGNLPRTDKYKETMFSKERAVDFSQANDFIDLNKALQSDLRVNSNSTVN